MRSYRLEGSGGTECLVMRDAPPPTPKPREIVVRVRATSLNRRDTMILNGTYPLTPRQGIVPLSDGAGEIIAIGDDVSRFAVGDRVTGSYFARWIDGRINAGLIDQLGCTLDGMLSEYAVLDEQWAVRLPDHLDWHEAATLTCAGVTAWNAVTGAGIPKPGQWVLVIGSGGVALFALQFARLLGCRVVAVTSRGEKIDRLRTFGADFVVSSTDTPEWGATVRDQTGGIDLVVETGGPATFAQSLIASTLYGHIVLLTLQDAQGRSIQMPAALYQRSLATISRLFVGSRVNLEAMLRAVSTHRLKPVVDKVFPFAEAAEAYRYFQQGDVFEGSHRRRLMLSTSTEHGGKPMTIREASAAWQGTLKEGSGRLRLGSGVFEGAYSFPSRFENGTGTNPEELIAAAHAGCFSMALTAILGRDGHIARDIRTIARVHLGATAAGPTITRIELETEAEVEDLVEDEFERLAQSAKAGCLVSRALAGVPQVTLKATLKGL